MKSIKAQDFKAKILSQIAPIGFNTHAFSLDLRMIKQPSAGKSAARIMMTDGGWVEYDPSGRTVRTWGPFGKAQILAQALASAIDVEVEHLAQTASVSAGTASLRVVKQSDDAIESLVGWWKFRGYSATTGPDGCWITAGRARILDTGNCLEIHGGVTDESIAAMLVKAKDAWGGGLLLYGNWTQLEQDRVWIGAQRQGIEVSNCRPSSSIREVWEHEQEVAAGKTKTISAVRTEIIEAQNLVDAAKGDIEAAKRLPGSLQAFTAIYLDDEQRRELASQPIAEIIPHLGRFRKLGASELESYKTPAGKKVAFAEAEKNNAGHKHDDVHVPQ